MPIAIGKRRRMLVLSKELWAWLDMKAQEKGWEISRTVEEAVEQWRARHVSKRGHGEVGSEAGEVREAA